VNEINNDREVMSFEGDMTIYTAESIKQDLFSEISKKKHIDVDLSDVSEFDTAGFQALIFGKKYASDSGIELRICGASEAVSEVFQLYGMSDVLESHHES